MEGKITPKRQTGDIGEAFAAENYEKRGHRIIARNYSRKWGELDVVAEKQGKVYFIEVKTVVRKNLNQTGDWYRPEENIHPWKIQRLGRVIQTFLLDKYRGREVEWQLDIASVYLNYAHELMKIDVLEDVYL